jgi:hypothetical protein
MYSKVVFAVFACSFVVLPLAAFADVASVKETRTGLAGEISIATDHAGYALASQNLDGVRMHLHHVLNCLEGPKGKNFDRIVENPCSTAGGGAIPDATDVAIKTKLQSIEMAALSGLDASDEAVARTAARDVQAALRALK